MLTGKWSKAFNHGWTVANFNEHAQYKTVQKNTKQVQKNTKQMYFLFFSFFIITGKGIYFTKSSLFLLGYTG